MKSTGPSTCGISVAISLSEDIGVNPFQFKVGSFNLTSLIIDCNLRLLEELVKSQEELVIRIAIVRQIKS